MNKLIEILKKYQAWAIGLSSFMTLCIAAYNGGASWVYKTVIESEAATAREDKIDSIIADWEKYKNDKNLPFTLRDLYHRRGVTVDSIAFDVMQLNNYTWSEMERYHITDSCRDAQCGPCKYWFRKDLNGTVWYRDKDDHHRYTVTWNNTVGSFEYTNNKNQKVFMKHCWERNRNQTETE